MKKFLLFPFLFFSLHIFANSGGPDGYGYTWKDSNAPGGPSFNWWDITSTGTPVTGLGDDNFVGPIQVGFQFQYYWYTESKVWVGSNGYIEFGPGNLAANFDPIPTPTGVNNYIGGMINDMTFLGAGNPGRVYYKATVDSFCVEFFDVPNWDPNSPGYNLTSNNTFEIILSKADSTITVNFMTDVGSSYSNFTSGIENSIGNFGLQPLNWQPPNPNYTIRYYYPPTALSITDGGVDWNDADGDGGIFLANNGSPYSMFTQIANHGNQSLSPMNVNGKIKVPPSNIFVNTNTTSLALTPGQAQIINFPGTFSPTTTGTREFVTTISGIAGDTINVNDSIIQEVVVVDTTQVSVRLNYTNNNTDPIQGSISWAGGAGGVGVYIKPPTYPARILSTHFVCAFAPFSGTAFYAKIYADNGPNGSPGTLLDSVAVQGVNVSANAVTLVPVSNYIVLLSGGIYVNWDMANANCAIAQDLTPPFSRQTYETFQNIWSTYRDYQTSDFFIGADYQCSVPEDVGVSSIVNPLNNATFNQTNVSCYIKNYGTAPDNYNIQVNYKLNNNVSIVSQPYTGAVISPGDSVLFNFTTPLVAPYSGGDILYVWTSKTSDVNHSNDTAQVNVNLVGVEEHVKLEGLSVYPIPANEKINFRFDDGTDGASLITITDIEGKTVCTKEIVREMPGGIYTLDVSALKPGTYFYSVRTADTNGRGKFILTR
ncbi:MAG: T9SS type A sorting domain-containing protein [Bacteroidetes bacterium]|nr:T9SS type A sorting domain-containing protein [Bacteroidota bacterium]